MERFTLIGAGGYIAPRHMKAIKETGNVLVATLDPCDSVGIIDSYFPDADFFTEFERFDRHLEKLRRENGQAVDYVSICSPNYLHDAHIRFALRIGADAVCEKPLVLNPWNIDTLEEISNETGRTVYTILQLRLHPAISEIKARIEQSPKTTKHDVDLAYITPRGHWYMISWKGDVAKSGGIATNIGIHFFDVMQWIFGELKYNVVHLDEPLRSAGFLEFESARVRWFLSIDRRDLPQARGSGELQAYRSVTIDGEEVDFSHGFSDLHTKSYQEILGGRGFTMQDARSAVEIVSSVRRAKPIGLKGEYHPLLKRSRG
ncbi:MAG: Gfo/Idh/MocA family oxidoreductase [Planctomycetota bacterium]|jgi:UDP-N-acetyl-2-amino-2-deoxyglucuronate dehydrogenase